MYTCYIWKDFEEENCTLTWGIFFADIFAWLKNILPKCEISGNTSACLGKLAPPESTKSFNNKSSKS